MTDPKLLFVAFRSTANYKAMPCKNYTTNNLIQLAIYGCTALQKVSFSGHPVIV